MKRGWIALACAGAALVAVASATGAGTTTSSGCSAPAVSGTTATVTCTYTGAVQTWTAPAGVTSATFTLYGAKGGDSALAVGGTGGMVTGTLPVAGGTSYDISVGGAGSAASDYVQTPEGFLYAPGGWPNGGGGAAGSAGGGGSTTVAIGGSNLVAAGGGGAAGADGGAADADAIPAYGAQGGLSGENGGIGGRGGPQPGDITGGFCTNATDGFSGGSAVGPMGGGYPMTSWSSPVDPFLAGGGGGGGIVGGGQGGGGGFNECEGTPGAGGGGGMSSPNAVPALAPGQNGNGLVVITYTLTRPTSKDQCKGNGWQSYGVFKNQGDCVSYVATGGKNGANG